MSFFRRLGRAAAHDGGADGVQDAGGEGPLGPLRRVLAQLVPHPLQRLDRRLRAARRAVSAGQPARPGDLDTFGAVPTDTCAIDKRWWMRAIDTIAAPPNVSTTFGGAYMYSLYTCVMTHYIYTSTHRIHPSSLICIHILIT